MVGLGGALVQNGKNLRDAKREKIKQVAADARQKLQIESTEKIAGDRLTQDKTQFDVREGRLGKAADALADYRSDQQKNQADMAAATADFRLLSLKKDDKLFDFKVKAEERASAFDAEMAKFDALDRAATKKERAGLKKLAAEAKGDLAVYRASTLAETIRNNKAGEGLTEKQMSDIAQDFSATTNEEGGTTGYNTKTYNKIMKALREGSALPVELAPIKRGERYEAGDRGLDKQGNVQVFDGTGWKKEVSPTVAVEKEVSPTVVAEPSPLVVADEQAASPAVRNPTPSEKEKLQNWIKGSPPPEMPDVYGSGGKKTENYEQKLKTYKQWEEKWLAFRATVMG